MSFSPHLHPEESFWALAFQEQNSVTEKEKTRKTTIKPQRCTTFQSGNRAHAARMTRPFNYKKTQPPQPKERGTFTSTIKNLFFSFCIEVSTCLHTM